MARLVALTTRKDQKNDQSGVAPGHRRCNTCKCVKPNDVFNFPAVPKYKCRLCHNAEVRRRKRLASALLLALLLPASACADSLTATAPVQSVTGRTGNVSMPTVCANTLIPTGNTVTGSVGGLAASTNQEWYGDVWITFLAGLTSMDVQGALTFQTGANASVTVPVANTAPFSIDPAKDLTIYLTVTWGSASTANSMQLRTMVAK